MANLSEQESWIDGIYQLETSDPVVAGPGGISNRQAEQLASRTAYLKKMQETTGKSLQTHLAASDPHSQYAPKNSPALTGTPTAPTTAQTTNNTQIATTAFVKTAIAALINGSPAALDTLQELANALGNDPNFSTTISNKLAQKLEKEQNGADIPDKAKFLANIGLKSAATRTVGTGASDIPDITIGDGRYLGKTTTAVAATKLAAARKIAGVLFDGTADIALTPENVGALAAAGTAAAATKLAVARTINGVAFDGTANISLTPASVGALPTAGTAAAAAKLAVARTINGVAFDGTTNISLTPASVGALPTAGTAAAATKLATARTINGIAFDGTANISLTPANVGALPTTGTAAAATKLATPRKINGVAFDGTTDITLSDNLGLKVVALLQFSTHLLQETTFKALDATTLEMTFDMKSRGQFIETGKTRVLLLNQSANASTSRFEPVGKFLVTSVNVPDSDTISTTIRVSYPGHGIKIGEQKVFRLAGFIYREIGCSWNGHVNTRNGSMYSYVMTLNEAVSSPNAPILATSSQDDYLYDNTFGTRTLGKDAKPSVVNAAMIGRDKVHFITGDNSTDNAASIEIATIMVYDL
ncbi:hypothetical protein [Pectobacterium aroidearum]|uniref:hypothetical protein n=1 Tax=Pectobacterium aroidearum TaxID=1201031 RepID=UPI001CD276A8|nr:hypothetical protein [Pectobacterium aroidearum]UUE46453.1 hypothetical protein L0Y28_07415 [Pectobacterium aroidearum]UUE50674.1 hypothetical protein L0Y23_07425 [Pectobacterium aroidearum]UUE54879.1 hypothetical protein L0Y30_07425 [Pectobacterium aroidearum]UUE63287.1 hypothetical protein L0Y29_07415 [Pectobacterium aroidearum]UUE67512.1 hypothetical protein L0Y22_07415 [Pectobacterium aroidearum]